MTFSKAAENEIKEMLAKTDNLLKYSLEMFEKRNEEHLKEILSIENSIDEMEKQFQQNHVIRLTEGECDAETGMLFTEMVSNLERVADHATNIAFSIFSGKKENEEA